MPATSGGRSEGTLSKNNAVLASLQLIFHCIHSKRNRCAVRPMPWAAPCALNTGALGERRLSCSKTSKRVVEVGSVMVRWIEAFVLQMKRNEAGVDRCFCVSIVASGMSVCG